MKPERLYGKWRSVEMGLGGAKEEVSFKESLCARGECMRECSIKNCCDAEEIGMIRRVYVMQRAESKESRKPESRERKVRGYPDDEEMAQNCQ